MELIEFIRPVSLFDVAGSVPRPPDRSEQVGNRNYAFAKFQKKHTLEMACLSAQRLSKVKSTSYIESRLSKSLRETFARDISCSELASSFCNPNN